MANIEEARAMIDTFLEPGRNVSRTDLENLKELLGDNAPQTNRLQKRAAAIQMTEYGKAPGILDLRSGRDEVTPARTLGQEHDAPDEPKTDEDPGHGAGDDKSSDVVDEANKQAAEDEANVQL